MKVFTFILTLLAFASCSKENTAFDDAYSLYSGNKEKQSAVRYLQQYSRYHYGIPRHFDKPDEIVALRVGVTQDTTFKHRLDSAGRRLITGSPVMDDDIISTDFIRENIDLAFDSWSRPWAKDVSFDDFCKYILPYRNGDEELHSWRKYFKDRYEPMILDSVKNLSSIPDVALFLIRQIRRDISYGPKTGRVTRELLTVEDMERIHWLECRGCAHYVALAMRACGIPCSMITINWRFTEIAHTTVLFPAIGSNKRAFRLTVGDEPLYMGEPKDTMASWRTWRYSYEVNKDLEDLFSYYVSTGKKHEAIKGLALPLTREDITSQVSSTYDISLPVPYSLRDKKYLFLCRFHNWRWYPIREGLVQKDSVYFKNATIRQWYRLGYADADSVSTFGDTFTLVGDSGIARKDKRNIVQLYNLSGDSVNFELVYDCDSCETRLTKQITTYYWGADSRWVPITKDAVLWGFNERTLDYKIFDESMRGTYIPIFHVLRVRLPRWTVLTDDKIPRPLGFLAKDPETDDGYLMQF
jgi:hypothetical protein